MNLLQTFSQINTIILDVDGVLTNGSVMIDSTGNYIRTMNIKDGYAIQLAIKNGYNIFVITGSQSEYVAKRLQYLGITEIHQSVSDKATTMQLLLKKYAIETATTLYIGDDMPDLKAMQLCAINACPADAAIDVVATANYISPYKGGEGCVRDVLEKIMKLQGKWSTIHGISSL